MDRALIIFANLVFTNIDLAFSNDFAYGP